MCTFRGLFASSISSERASDQELNSAGESVTEAREKSRTLICAKQRKAPAKQYIRRHARKGPREGREGKAPSPDFPPES